MKITQPTSLELQNQRVHRTNHLPVTDNHPGQLYRKSAWLRVQRLAFNSQEGHGFSVQYLNTWVYGTVFIYTGVSVQYLNTRVSVQYSNTGVLGTVFKHTGLRYSISIHGFRYSI